MNFLLLNFIRRHWILLLFQFVLTVVLWQIGLVAGAAIVLVQMSVLFGLAFDIQTGIFRGLSSLPLSRVTVGRSFWLETLGLGAMLNLAAMAVAAGFRDGPATFGEFLQTWLPGTALLSAGFYLLLFASRNLRREHAFLPLVILVPVGLALAKLCGLMEYRLPTGPEPDFVSRQHQMSSPVAITLAVVTLCFAVAGWLRCGGLSSAPKVNWREKAVEKEQEQAVTPWSRYRVQHFEEIRWFIMLSVMSVTMVVPHLFIQMGMPNNPGNNIISQMIPAMTSPMLVAMCFATLRCLRGFPVSREAIARRHLRITLLGASFLAGMMTLWLTVTHALSLAPVLFWLQCLTTWWLMLALLSRFTGLGFMMLWMWLVTMLNMAPTLITSICSPPGQFSSSLHLTWENLGIVTLCLLPVWWVSFSCYRRFLLTSSNLYRGTNLLLHKTGGLPAN